MTSSRLFFFSILISAQPAYAFAKLTPAATAAFDRYIQLSEARMNGGSFLQIDSKPEMKTRVRSGETVIQSNVTRDNGKPIDIP